LYAELLTVHTKPSNFHTATLTVVAGRDRTADWQPDSSQNPLGHACTARPPGVLEARPALLYYGVFQAGSCTLCE